VNSVIAFKEAKVAANVYIRKGGVEGDSVQPPRYMGWPHAHRGGKVGILID